MALTLIIGGARSGKSTLALRLARASNRPVTFIATMIPGDDELRSRVDVHRAERPRSWRTVEAPGDPAAALASIDPAGFAVIDCITLWVSNLLLAASPNETDLPPAAANIAVDDIVTRSTALADSAARYEGDVCMVTNEVGSGVVPAYALGRAFRDALGAANGVMARRAECVYSVTAGLAVDLKALGARTIDAFDEGRAD